MTNPVRTCPVCTQTDDHPRHVTDIGGGTLIALHMDCCAASRDCGICSEQISGAKNAKGDKLRDHLLKTGPDPDKPGWTAPTNPDDLPVVGRPGTTRKDG